MTCCVAAQVLLDQERCQCDLESERLRLKEELAQVGHLAIIIQHLTHSHHTRSSA